MINRKSQQEQRLSPNTSIKKLDLKKVHKRYSSEGIPNEIVFGKEIIESNRQLFSTNSSNFFQPFQEQINTFRDQASQLPSSITRLQYSLTHNNQQKSFLSSHNSNQQQITISQIINKINQRSKIEKQSRQRIQPKKQKNQSNQPSIQKNILQRPSPTFYFEIQQSQSTLHKPPFFESTTISLFQDHLYIYGGLTSTGINQDILTYNLNNHTWNLIQKQGQYPFQAMISHTVIQYKNQLIFFGGSLMFNKKVKARECLNTIHSFNLITKLWSKVYPLGDYISPRRNHKSCLYGKKHMLVYGGIGTNEKVLSDIAIFNLEKGVWKYFGEQDGQELAYHAIVNVTRVRGKEDLDQKEHYPKDEIYCFGGKDSSQTSNNIMKQLVYNQSKELCQIIFPIATEFPDHWEPIQSVGVEPYRLYNHTMEYLVKYHALVVIGGRIEEKVNFGDDLGVSEIFLFQIKGSCWQKVNLKGDNLSRSAHGSLNFGESRIIIFGGIGKYNFTDTNVGIIETGNWKYLILYLKEYSMVMYKVSKHQKGEIKSPQSERQAKIENWVTQENYFQRKKKALNEGSNIRSFLPVPRKKPSKIRFDILSGMIKNMAHVQQQSGSVK